MANDVKLKVIIDQSGNAKAGISSIAGSVGKLGGLAATAATGGLLLAGAGIVALGAGLVSSVGAAMEAQQGQAQLAAVLKSTGGAAGMTADAVNDLASQFQAITPFSDDAILAGENILLTFTNIGKEVFPDATQATLDMATAMGTDTTSAAMQLGKALNDPIAGIGALSRVGVTFTDAQKETIKAMVKMGDTAGAQKIILAELNKEFGGSAEAAGNTLPGKLEILKNTFGDIQETIGGAFLPVLSDVADQFAAGLNSPEGQAMLERLTGFITDNVIPAIKDIAAFVGDAAAIFADWTSHLSETTGPAMIMIQDALDRISVATGGATGEFSIAKTLLAALKLTLDAVTTAIKLVAVGFQAAAWSVEQISRAVRIAKDLGNQIGQIYTESMRRIKDAINAAIAKWNDFKKAVKSAVDAIPDWLLPGSPPPFAVGLQHIADAAGNVASELPAAFTVPRLGGAGLAPAMAGASGGSPVIINLTWAPMISTADRNEVETKLVPLLKELLQK